MGTGIDAESMIAIAPRPQIPSGFSAASMYSLYFSSRLPIECFTVFQIPFRAPLGASTRLVRAVRVLQ